LECLFCWRANHRVGAQFPLYHTLHFLSIGKVNKYLAAQIPKLVQNYHLIFKKIFVIIYLQGKERNLVGQEKISKKTLDK